MTITTMRTPAPGRPHPADAAALLPSMLGGARALAAALAPHLSLAAGAWHAEDPIGLVPRVLRG